MNQVRNSALADAAPVSWRHSPWLQRYVPIALLTTTGLMVTAVIFRMVEESEWEVAAAGVAFTALFAAYLVILTGRTAEVEGMVARRTIELEMEIGERKQAEAKIQEQYVDIQIHTLELEAANDDLRQTQQKLLEANLNLEKKVKDRTAELEAANDELKAFTYSVSHDLRAPLRHINGFSRILLNECQDQLPEYAKSYLLKIGDSASSLGALVDGLLNLSRINRENIIIKRVDLNGILDEVIADLRSETASRDINLKIQQLPQVECDPVLIKQVLVNLLSNAIKFTRNTKRTVIEVKPLPDAKPGFMVRDNGAGFDMEYADKLFGVFERMHKKSDFEGNGIGLATVKRIVVHHNGRVWAESTVNRGSTFYVELPAPPAKELKEE
ncbi:MAG: ATP-binding protein [Dehalococcoidia bacterium]|nr:ATP-binding protein [Dehalococcoidia bacterium]